MRLAFSVDLEPNKDGSFEDVEGAMSWFDDTVPTGTVFATHRVATERPSIVEGLAQDHEIGVHVHPREFGHEDDQLAALPPERQRTLIAETREALEPLADGPVQSFRAGRHSASEETFAVLADLGFEVDASVNVRYTEFLPDGISRRSEPFALDSGLYEVPTTYVRPPLLSRVGLHVFSNRSVTATAATLRSDSLFCSGTRAVASIRDARPFVSFYMHPYDATEYHDLRNAGPTFRRRVERLVEGLGDEEFLTVSDVADGRR